MDPAASLVAQLRCRSTFRKALSLILFGTLLRAQAKPWQSLSAMNTALCKRSLAQQSVCQSDSFGEFLTAQSTVLSMQSDQDGISHLVLIRISFRKKSSS